MPSAQNQIQIVDTHETSETLAVTRLQRVGYQINRTLLAENNVAIPILVTRMISQTNARSFRQMNPSAKTKSCGIGSSSDREEHLPVF